MQKILIVDDDPKLLKMLRRTLMYENFEVLTAVDGKDALSMIDAKQPDLIIADWMMPEMDGMELVLQLRDEDNLTPILMLTARDAVENRVEGLQSGADDYLVKPFAPSELVARVHALLRRLKPTSDEQKILTFEDLSMNELTREVTRGDSKITLTKTEYKLLNILLKHPRQVLERQQLLDNVWGYDFGGEGNVLEIYISYLRKKIETNGKPRIIQTVHGIGYSLRI